MSAILIPDGANIVQVSAWSEGDTYTHIRAGNVMNAGISCDTTADLPAQAGGISGYYLEQGSTAHVIADNTTYTINSSGTWVLQDTSPYNNIYTKSEIDDIINGIDDDIANIEKSIQDISDVMINLINTGNKNLVCNTAQTGTHNNVTFTVNDDLSVTLSGGVASQYYSFRISGDQSDTSYQKQIPIPRGTYILSGLPSGASSSTYRYILGIRTASDQTRVTSSIYDGTYEFTVDNDTTRFDLAIYTATGADYTYPVQIFPMISRKDEFTFTDKYVSGSPSNAELYKMIRSYHP